MEIRKATLKDYEQLKEMKMDFMLEEYKLFDKDINKRYPKVGMPRQLKKNLKSKKVGFFMALDRGKAVGFIGGEIEKAHPFWRFKRVGYLFNLYVIPSYRRKGMGKELTKAILDWFKKRKIKWIKLHVYANNPRAHSLYKKLGFKDFLIELKKVVR
ncbi:GNAT family N-acetyltransferase [Candidatus Woesearchaeota archaeon]|nr:GNAT family N-acetyltransferase [Candidatus Woesearchaeota archaeon]